MKITIIGIGQQMRGDDEAGLAAVALWQEKYPNTATDPSIRVELAESPGIGLLNLMETADAVILVDAVFSGVQPGTLVHLSHTDLAAYLQGTGSAHGWGVAETLALGEKISPETLPETILIIGIEAGQVSLGEPLSPAVSASLEGAAALIQDTVQSLLHDDGK
jgi:hydrogenase maturation protease